MRKPSPVGQAASSLRAQRDQPEIFSVRGVATHFGHVFGRDPVFMETGVDDALLSDATRARILRPSRRTAGAAGGMGRRLDAARAPTLSRPTHFETRDGSF
jgi:hypothetical protein